MVTFCRYPRTTSNYNPKQHQEGYLPGPRGNARFQGRSTGWRRDPCPTVQGLAEHLPQSTTAQYSMLGHLVRVFRWLPLAGESAGKIPAQRSRSWLSYPVAGRVILSRAIGVCPRGRIGVGHSTARTSGRGLIRLLYSRRDSVPELRFPER
jgi:hypothetical protein